MPQLPGILDLPFYGSRMTDLARQSPVWRLASKVMKRIILGQQLTDAETSRRLKSNTFRSDVGHPVRGYENTVFLLFRLGESSTALSGPNGST